MESTELQKRYTKDIRDLSNQKSELQTAISELTSKETKLNITISKLNTAVVDKETNLTKIKADEETTLKQIESNRKRLGAIQEQLEVKATELSATEKQIQLKKEQAKSELKDYIDATILEAKAKSASIIAEANALHENTVRETMRITDEANTQASETLEQAESQSIEKRRSAEAYYDAKITKGDAEYNNILQKASEKHGAKIQESIEHLATLNNKIEQSNTQIGELAKEEELKMQCLMELEDLISEKRVELNGLERLLLDKNNVLGSFTKQDSPELLESISNLEKLINDLNDEKNRLVERAERLELEHAEAMEDMKESHMLAMETLKIEHSDIVSDLNETISELNEKNSEQHKAYTELTSTCSKLQLEAETLQQEVVTLKSELDKANDDRDNYRGKFEELTLKCENFEFEKATLTLSIQEQEDKVSDLATQLLKKTDLLDEKTKEFTNLVESQRTMQRNQSAASNLQANLTQTKGDFNKAVEIMASTRNKVIELILGVGIILMCMIFTFMFAEGSMLYLGYAMIAGGIITTSYSAYKLYANLTLVRAMETNADLPLTKQVN